MRTYLVTLFFILSFYSINVLSNEYRIQTVSDIWCPYSCLADAENKGLSVDIANAIFKPYGYSIEYETMSWSRALRETYRGRADIALTAVKGNTSGNLLNNLPVAKDESVIVVRQGDSFEFKSMNQLDSLKLGTIAGYTYDNNGDLDKYLDSRKALNQDVITVSTENGVEQLFKMLEAQRLDGFIENRYVVLFYLGSKKAKNKFEIITTNHGDLIHFAFSPNQRGKALLEIFNEEFPRFKKSKEYRKILSQYGIKN